MVAFEYRIWISVNFRQQAVSGASIPCLSPRVQLHSFANKEQLAFGCLALLDKPATDRHEYFFFLALTVFRFFLSLRSPYVGATKLSPSLP